MFYLKISEGLGLPKWSKIGITSPAYSLRQLTGYFFKLGYSGFGGPVALVGYMHRDLVEEKKWISEEDYKEGLALAQLAPGPLAAQLGIYIGFVHYRVLGATLAGLAFIIPSFLMVVGPGNCLQIIWRSSLDAGYFLWGGGGRYWNHFAKFL